MGKKFIDITGERFGELIILRRVAPVGGQTCAHWLCRCDCGNEFVSQSGALLNGYTKRCINCRHSLRRKCNNKRILNTWNHMLQRCYVEKSKHYHDYGGRGIVVCEEWRTDPKNFENWAVQNGYADNLTIDRIDVNGNYEPNNCRWATNKEQQNNKRTNRYVESNGKRQTIKEWADELGMNEYRIRYRMNQGVTDPNVILSKEKIYRLSPYINQKHVEKEGADAY
ncbi:hypothetical protein H6F38_14470 [Paenibacillus sp. EKM208P]|nr:hypothetical protein H6F38_14470 [Paenibacillus sp. EKM208P]